MAKQSWEKTAEHVAEMLKKFGYESCFVCGINPEELIKFLKENNRDGDLVSNCCASDFDPFGFEKEEGIWQEKCLNCKKLCEPIYLSKRDIENIKRCLSWNYSNIP